MRNSLILEGLREDIWLFDCRLVSVPIVQIVRRISPRQPDHS